MQNGMVGTIVVECSEGYNCLGVCGGDISNCCEQTTSASDNYLMINQDGGTLTYLTIPLSEYSGSVLNSLSYSIDWNNQGWGVTSIESNARVRMFDADGNVLETFATIYENSTDGGSYENYSNSYYIHYN